MATNTRYRQFSIAITTIYIYIITQLYTGAIIMNLMYHSYRAVLGRFEVQQTRDVPITPKRSSKNARPQQISAETATATGAISTFFRLKPRTFFKEYQTDTPSARCAGVSSSGGAVCPKSQQTPLRFSIEIAKERKPGVVPNRESCTSQVVLLPL